MKHIEKIERVAIETAHMAASLYPDCKGIRMDRQSSVMTLAELFEEVDAIVCAARMLGMSETDEKE